MASIHNRMPAILKREDEERWLDTSLTKPDDILSLLRPNESKEMEAFPVAKWVNSPGFDDPRCIEGITEEA